MGFQQTASVLVLALEMQNRTHPPLKDFLYKYVSVRLLHFLLQFSAAYIERGKKWKHPKSNKILRGALWNHQSQQEVAQSSHKIKEKE